MGLGSQLTSEDYPSRIIVRDCAMALDGGTISLIATDDAGHPVSITLTTTLPRSSCVAGRLYFNGTLVPMRSERETQVLKLLSEAAVEAPGTRCGNQSQMTIIGEDIKEFFEQTPEENCRTFIRKIIDAVQSEHYLRYTNDDDKALAEEANCDVWERPSGKKKRRPWRRGG